MCIKQEAWFSLSPSTICLYLYFLCSRQKTLASTSSLSVADCPAASTRWLLSRFTPSPFARSRWGGWYHRLDWTDHCFLWGCGANTNSSKVKAIHNVVKDTVAVIKVIAKGVHVKTTIHSYSLSISYILLSHSLKPKSSLFLLFSHFFLLALAHSAARVLSTRQGRHLHFLLGDRLSLFRHVISPTPSRVGTHFDVLTRACIYVKYYHHFLHPSLSLVTILLIPLYKTFN